MTPSLVDLRREHQELGIGPQLAELLARIVDATAPTYPATEYTDDAHWSPAALEDLLHDWVEQRLVRRGHLALMMATASSLPVLRSSLTTSLRQCLVNRRRRTSASNLFKRIQSMLEQDDAFQRIGPATKPAAQLWTLRGATAAPSTLELKQLVDTAFELGDDNLEVVRYGPTSLKSSPILRQPNLRRFLQHLLRRSGGALSLGRIAEVVRYRFNLVLHSAEELDEELASDQPPDVGTVEVADAAARAMARMGLARLEVLRELQRTESLDGAATALRISRSSAARRLREAMVIVGEYAESLEEARDVYRRIVESLF